MNDAKRMLKSGEYTTLIADVTNFEISGRRLIAWAKHHVSRDDFRTHGYTVTDLPSIEKKIYSRGVDQKFYYDHVDVDHLTEMLFSLFIDHPELRLVIDLQKGQKDLSKKIGDRSACDAPVLLHGAKGMGKESLAQIIHGLSNRSAYEFIVLDCNPRQKFDYAYAQNRDTPKNRRLLKENFQRMLGHAQNGTLYIRSFTHLTLMSQEVLMEVLEEGNCILPCGEKVPYEGRIIFSTNKSLSEKVTEKKVSPDLYKKLMELVLRIRPLAEYREDLLHMAESVMSHFCLKGRGKIMEIMPDAQRAISNHSWSGNLDEMRMAMCHAVSEAENLRIRARDLPFIHELPRVNDKATIEETLRKYKGNKSKVHKELNISRSHLYKLIDRYGISSDFPNDEK